MFFLPKSPDSNKITFFSSKILNIFCVHNVNKDVNFLELTKLYELIFNYLFSKDIFKSLKIEDNSIIATPVDFAIVYGVSPSTTK